MARKSKARKSRSVHRRRNPTGTLLVNSGKKGKRSSRKRNKSLSLKRFLRGMRNNPLLANPGKKRRGGKSRRRSGYRSNSLLANPLLANPHRSKHRGGKRSRSRGRHNPITINRRRNPGMVTKVSGTIQRILNRIPVIGGLLAGAVGVLGGAVGGAIGVYPISYAMPYVSKWVPDWLKPFGYTVAGAILSSIVKMLPLPIPYKAQLAIGLAAAGGAVDAFRFRTGQSDSLAGEGDYSSTEDYGDIGDDGSAFAAHEWADADLGDADYSGDDFSSVEIAAFDLGRQHFARRFLRRSGQGRKQGGEGGKQGGEGGGGSEGEGAVAEGVSEHAGKPGRRWAWLIYWIGFDNARKVTKLPDNERQDAIAHMKREAKLNARKLLSEGADTSIEQAEMAGLLVA